MCIPSNLGDKIDLLIAELLAQGKSDKEIAEKTKTSLRMIKWRTSRFMRMLNLYGNADTRRLVVAAASGRLQQALASRSGGVEG